MIADITWKVKDAKDGTPLGEIQLWGFRTESFKPLEEALRKGMDRPIVLTGSAKKNVIHAGERRTS